MELDVSIFSNFQQRVFQKIKKYKMEPFQECFLSRIPFHLSPASSSQRSADPCLRWLWGSTSPADFCSLLGTEPLLFLFLYQLNSCPEGVHQGLHRAPAPQTCRVDQWRSSSFSCTTVDHHWWHRRCAMIAPKRNSHCLGLITCFCPVCYVVT